jgi:vancomycin resistance protein YoaR
MIAVSRVEDEDGARYEVQFDTTQFRTFLTQLAPDLAVEPINARYVFDDETGQISPIEESVNGRTLDVEGSIARIQQAITQTDPAARDVPLKFKVSVPAAHTHATGEELGITELVVEATTYYHGSSAVRKTNIVQAASRFHGIVIAPGEEFSFNKYIGEISKETGYEEGLIIYNNKTITGVGGGVCQVSTTAFQAAFYGGYDITLRWPHAYRVSYYEYGEGAGMDATVFSPDVDFRFINDTPYHLLIETYPSPASSTLTFKFYSTSMNRSVEKDGPYIVNGRGGTQDVTIYRTVYQDGDVLREDSFFSHYIPEPAMSSSDDDN